MYDIDFNVYDISLSVKNSEFVDITYKLIFINNQQNMKIDHIHLITYSHSDDNWHEIYASINNKLCIVNINCISTTIIIHNDNLHYVNNLLYYVKGDDGNFYELIKDQYVKIKLLTNEKIIDILDLEECSKAFITDTRNIYIAKSYDAICEDGYVVFNKVKKIDSDISSAYSVDPRLYYKKLGSDITYYYEILGPKKRIRIFDNELSPVNGINKLYVKKNKRMYYGNNDRLQLIKGFILDPVKVIDVRNKSELYDIILLF